MADKRESIGDISVKVNVEVSEAITGLKALQREAKAATQALAELRDYMEATGEVTLKNGAEVVQSLRALFDRLGEDTYKGYISGGKLSGKESVTLDRGEQIVPLQDGTRSNRKGDR